MLGVIRNVNSSQTERVNKLGENSSALWFRCQKTAACIATFIKSSGVRGLLEGMVLSFIRHERSLPPHKK